MVVATMEVEEAAPLAQVPPDHQDQLVTPQVLMEAEESRCSFQSHHHQHCT